MSHYRTILHRFRTIVKKSAKSLFVDPSMRISIGLTIMISWIIVFDTQLRVNLKYNLKLQQNVRAMFNHYFFKPYISEDRRWPRPAGVPVNSINVSSGRWTVNQVPIWRTRRMSNKYIISHCFIFLFISNHSQSILNHWWQTPKIYKIIICWKKKCTGMETIIPYTTFFHIQLEEA